MSFLLGFLVGFSVSFSVVGLGGSNSGVRVLFNVLPRSISMFILCIVSSESEGVVLGV